MSVRYAVRSRISEHPRLYLPIARARHPEAVVCPDTELVIDGFERSGNWFAVTSFEMAQREQVRVAHHLHSVAQVREAVRLQIPTLVLVRRPDDTVASQMIRTPGVGATQALRAWMRYYRAVSEVRDRIVLADFSDVTQHLGSVIREVNERFATKFLLPDPVTAEVFARIEQINRERYGKLVETAVARPSSDRTERRGKLLREIRLSRAFFPVMHAYEDLL